jgi:predicted transcriptional regulator
MSREVSAVSLDIAAIVRETIDDMGVTRAGVARAAGIPRTTFYRRLNGSTPFYLHELFTVSRILGMQASDLVERAGH